MAQSAPAAHSLPARTLPACLLACLPVACCRTWAAQVFKPSPMAAACFQSLPQAPHHAWLSARTPVDHSATRCRLTCQPLSPPAPTAATTDATISASTRLASAPHRPAMCPAPCCALVPEPSAYPASICASLSEPASIPADLMLPSCRASCRVLLPAADHSAQSCLASAQPAPSPAEPPCSWSAPYEPMAQAIEP